jgi:hypothetical protein
VWHLRFPGSIDHLQAEGLQLDFSVRHRAQFS